MFICVCKCLRRVDDEDHRFVFSIKQVAADPDLCGSAFCCNPEVIAHAHGQNPDLVSVPFPDSVEQCFAAQEGSADLFFVFGVRSHGHDAFQMNVRKLHDFIDENERIFLRKSGFVFILQGKMELCKAGHDFIDPCAFFLYHLCQGKIVQRFNHGYIGSDGPDFVSLQMTDEMPFDIGREILLGKDFLCVVLTETALPQCIICHDFLLGACFGYHKQTDIRSDDCLYFFIVINRNCIHRKIIPLEHVIINVMEMKETRDSIARLLVILAIAIGLVSLSMNLVSMWLEKRYQPPGGPTVYQETSVVVNIMMAGQVDYVSEGQETDISLLVETVPNYDYAVFKQRTLVPVEGESTAADALAWVGFDAVCLADEHSLSFGKEGVEASLEYWNDKKLLCAGTNISTDQQNLIRPVDLGGITAVVLSFTESLDDPMPEAAHYLVNLYDPEKSPEIVRAAAEQADIVIVCIDWWQDYMEITEQQKETARQLADAGASIIMGSAGHEILPVCWIDDTLVFYGMGDLMSNDVNVYGLIGAVTVTKSTLNDKTRVELTNPRVDVVCGFHKPDKYYVTGMTDVDSEMYRKKYDEICSVLHSLDDSIRLGGIR